MFRTVTVYNGERISVKDGWMAVTNGEEEHRIPIEDLYSVVIDNQQTSLTVPAITRLTEAGAHILVCNEKHLPMSVILPKDTHYHPLDVIKKQIMLPEDIKNRLWDAVVKSKITNQADVLKICGGEQGRVNRLFELANEVTDGDSGNREGIAAKMFFRDMYGFEFIRMYDDSVNAALNYGYAIIRSAVAKTLTAYGYNCVLGIHHISVSNPFNLADDMMEPLRPVVDMWVYENQEDLLDELTKRQKNELAALVNSVVLWDGKRMKMRNAIDRYISSLTSAINNLSPKLLKFPEIIRWDIYDETDD